MTRVIIVIKSDSCGFCIKLMQDIKQHKKDLRGIEVILIDSSHVKVATEAITKLSTAYSDAIVSDVREAFESVRAYPLVIDIDTKRSSHPVETHKGYSEDLIESLSRK